MIAKTTSRQCYGFFFLYFIRFVGYMLFYNSITCILTSAACLRVCAVSKKDIYCTFWNQLHVFPIITIPSRNLDVFLLSDRLMECSPCSLHMVSPSAPASLSDSRLWRGFLYLLKDLQLSTGRKKNRTSAAWVVLDESLEGDYSGEDIQFRVTFSGILASRWLSDQPPRPPRLAYQLLHLINLQV